jgi:divalent metal cation (Fe/Co/Zn/Cd) transporter
MTEEPISYSQEEKHNYAGLIVGIVLFLVGIIIFLEGYNQASTFSLIGIQYQDATPLEWTGGFLAFIGLVMMVFHSSFKE